MENKYVLTGLLCLMSVHQTEAFAGERPNIIIILADDMGFSDVGCYGGEIETPNIDYLAQNGIRYRQFYNGARSCPTRASLLTGLYAHQAGMGWMAAADLGYPAYQGTLNHRCMTIAEVLKMNGYQTYMSGKWHVSSDRENNGGIKDNWPNQRGFDEFFGITGGAANYFRTRYNINNDVVDTPADSDFYFTHAISEHAVGFIARHDYNVSPLFLYLAYTAPHWPLHALQADIDKYRDVYRKGWDRLREERFERQKESGLFAPDVVLSPRDGAVPAWNSLTKEEQDEFAQRMAIYAAQIDALDQGVGKVIGALKERGQLENTMILFLSDNGACAEYISSGRRKAVDGKVDTYESYRRNWANLSSTPFREYKHFTNEGGIATPLIVHYPNGIRKELLNTFVGEYGHITDIMATCVDVAGATYPAVYKGNSITPMQGVSLKPNFEGRTTGRGMAFWEHEANIGVRKGKWKLVSKTLEGAQFKEKDIQLYNLDEDPTELTDLSRQYPEIRNELYERWKEWAVKVGVFPMDTREYGVRQRAYKRNRINGDFDCNFGDWVVRTHSDCKACYSIEKEQPIHGSKSARIEVLKPGNRPSDNFMKWGFPARKGEKFVITFVISGNTEAGLVHFRLEGGKDSSVRLVDEAVRPDKEVARYRFESEEVPADGNYRIAFYTGTFKGKVLLDNVTLTGM